MLRPRDRKVLRDVWHHKARTALVVAAIAIGIVGAGTVLNTWSLLRRVTREEFQSSNPASAILRTDSVDAALMDRIRALPGIGAAQARRTTIARAQVQGAWQTAMLFSADDLDHTVIGRIAAESGAWPPADGAVVIERSSLEFAATGMGERLLLQIGDGPERALTVTGIARDAGLAPGWMEHVVYAFVTPATLASLGSDPRMNQVQIVVRDRALDREAIRRVAFEVKALIEATGRSVRDVDVPEPGAHVHAAQINSLLYTQGAFGLLALLLSGFLVVNLVSAMLAGQVREIGVMKALGARGGQIAGMYLGLALVLGLGACIVALPAAALLGRWYAGFTATLLNFDTRGFAIPGWSILAQLAVGALLPVAAASVPVWRGCRVPVSQALRDFGIDGGGEPAGRLLSRIGGVTRPLLLSLRNAFRKRQRMALTLITLALGGAVYLGALNLRTSIGHSVDEMFGGSLKFDLTVQFAKAYAADSVEAAVSRVTGVSRAEAWSSRRAQVERGDGVPGNGFALTALPPDSRMVEYQLRSGRWLTTADTNALVVSQRLLNEDSQLSPSGDVTLLIGGRRTRWTVVGVVEAGIQPSAFTSPRALALATGDSAASVVVIMADARDPARQADLSRRLRGDLPDAGLEVSSGQLMSESRRVLEDHLLLVAGFLSLMAQAMIVVGGLGLASTMSLAVLERTREIGVLRAIGAKHGAIILMVQIEGLVIAVASWALAVPLSVPMSIVLGRAFGRIMFPIRQLTVMPGTGALLVWLAVAVGVSIVACAWPASRALRVTTAAALAYE